MCMVAAMIGSFFTCWLPYAIVSMLVILMPDISISPLLASMPAHLAKTSPAYNPIIFFLAKKQVSQIWILKLITSGAVYFVVHSLSGARLSIIDNQQFFPSQFRDMALEIMSCGCYRPMFPNPSSAGEVEIVETDSKRLSPNTIQPEPALTDWDPTLKKTPKWQWQCWFYHHL